MEHVVNALGRFSHLFGAMVTEGNVAAADLVVAQQALDRAAAALAQKHGVDYGALVNENLREGREYPTTSDLNELKSVGLRAD